MRPAHKIRHGDEKLIRNVYSISGYAIVGTIFFPGQHFTEEELSLEVERI